MDVKKMAEFNARMGKKQKFSKGGMIRKIAGRHYFDVGGSTTVAAVSPTPSSVGGASQQGSTASVPQWAASGVSNPIGSAGASAQGIASAFTAQNQYQAQLAPTVQSNYQPVIDAGATAATNGYNQFNQNLGQEQALNTQLGQIAAGQGPNPAQTALAQNTSTNVANQAALMAGQRGASANAGLIARQAAQQGAATQQQAVGQAATTQANQSLAALGQQQTLLGNTGNQITSEQGANTTLLGTGASAQNAQNNTNVSNYGMAQGINAQTAQNNTNAVNQTTSGLMNGAGSLAALLADGGVVQEPDAPNVNIPSFVGPAVGVKMPSLPSPGGNKSSGPSTATSSNNYGAAQFNQPQLGDSSGLNSGMSVPSLEARGGKVCPGPHKSHVANYLAQGGAVPAMVSPGEIYLSPEKVQRVIHGGENPLKIGEKIKGKAKVSGDSLKNDTVSKTLEEGGVVIPRHILKHKSIDKAELFTRRAVHMRAPKGGQ